MTVELPRIIRIVAERIASLNIERQKVLNPRPPQSFALFGYAFAMGDKVMQIENDYDKDVYNGDIGFLRAIDQDLVDVTVE